ncbi:MAG: DNA polymerase III subunit alpha, partial [Gemmatimonadota bacterium]
QFEKDGAEDAGLVKIDLLGNRSLAVIRDAIASVRTRTGHQIDYTTADPEDDEPTRALFRSGRTMGVFYTESPASRLLCAKSKADTFELLVLNTSIIRPASNRFIRVYLERLHGKPYEPLDPSLRDTLASTFGVMVYQEDVVNVASVFAGMPLATGDGLRKALSKKRPVKQLVAYAEEFFAGADRLRRDPETAKRVWEMIMSFAGYSFCKGHSCSYIRVAQHSCYLRAHHPAHFMAAVLANGGGFYHPFAYVAEAMRMGLTVHPPDVNASAYRCEGHDREVRIGLQFIKGLSADGCRRLLEARDGSGRPVRQFTSLADLRHRARLSAEDLRTLIKVGACDTIAGEWTRPMLLWMVDAESVGAKERRNGDQMESWLDRDTGELAAEVERSVEIVPAQRPAQSADEHYLAVPMLREYPAERRRREEFAALGFTTDCHPMDLYAEELRRFRICRTPELHRHVGKTVLLAGMLTTAKPVHTVTDEPMEFATFDDGEGLVEAVLFPEIYRARGHVLFDQGPFIFRGRVEEEFGAITVTLTHLDRLERMLDKLGARRPGR